MCVECVSPKREKLIMIDSSVRGRGYLQVLKYGEVE